MQFQIRCRFTTKVLFEGDYPTLKACVEAAVKAGANLSRADLAGADLSGAKLSGAKLSGANLTNANLTGADLTNAYLTRADLAGADLSGAKLSGAKLSGANLTNANLTGADLTNAYLTGADLTGADLTGAYLAGAKLTGAKNIETCRLDTGETVKEYREQVVPALIAAGGKTLDDPAVASSWNCHHWENCPMHTVFGINSESEAPIFHRPRVKQFVQLFDAGWLPAETIPGLAVVACPTK